MVFRIARDLAVAQSAGGAHLEMPMGLALDRDLDILVPGNGARWLDPGSDNWRTALGVLRAVQLPLNPNKTTESLIVSRLLEDLFVWYVQDFDIVFERDTDPIDQFCEQHKKEEQVQLLSELRELYGEVLIGTKTWRDVRALGLEYWPAGLRNPQALLFRLLEHLEARLAGTKQT
jgi:hypothetical protein